METVQQVKNRVLGRDQDYYVNYLANHKQHIARSKAKAKRYHTVSRLAGVDEEPPNPIDQSAILSILREDS